jgi:predicted deacylase
MTTTVRRIPISHFADGTEVALFLHELVGTRGAGPTFGISAAIHGNEPTGTQVVMEVARRYADGDFRGRLLLLPVANPHSFQANVRFTPIDGQNLNRVFPGKANGMFTDQLALKVKEVFLDRIDAYADFHTGTDRPTVDYTYIHNAEDLSRAFGTKLLYRPQAGKGGPVFDGTSKSVTTARGVPSVTIELGGGVVDQSPYVARGVAGIVNMMRTLGMLDEAPVPTPGQIVVHAIATIYPTQGGFLRTEAPALGEEIAGEAVLGRVISPYTFEELEVIRNPVQQGVMILSHLTPNLVQPGDFGYMVGDLDGCERLRP